MKYWNFNEHVKMPQLTKFLAYNFKNGKVTGPWKYLLQRHTDFIKALNLELYNFFWKIWIKIPQLAKFVLFILKNSKVTRSFMFLIISHYDVIQTLNFKINNMFEKQVNITHVTEFWVYTLTSKLQDLCKLPIMTSYWWRHRNFKFEN